jgi:hypothetical protein
MDQVSIKYTIIFRCKTLQNLPKFRFWFENKPSGNPETQNDRQANFEGHFARSLKTSRRVADKVSAFWRSYYMFSDVFNTSSIHLYLYRMESSSLSQPLRHSLWLRWSFDYIRSKRQSQHILFSSVDHRNLNFKVSGLWITKIYEVKISRLWLNKSTSSSKRLASNWVKQNEGSF